MLKIGHSKVTAGDGHSTAYALLEMLWQEAFGGQLPQIARTRLGKPYFVNEKIYFSVAHTKNNAFCVLADVPVGIDAEETDRKVNPTLAEKILSLEEYGQYIAAEDKNRALLTFWVLKEAQGKCTGEGVRIYPNHTSFSLDDPRVWEKDGCLVAVIKEDGSNAF